MSHKLATALTCLVMTACTQQQGEPPKAANTSQHNYSYLSEFDDVYGNSYVYEDGFSHSHKRPAVVNGYLQGAQAGVLYSRRQLTSNDELGE